MKPTTNNDTKSAATHDQAPIESFVGHFNHERPHLNDITDAELPDTEPARVRIDHNRRTTPLRP